VEVPNPLRLNFPEPGNGTGNGAPTLGFLGRLEPRKGVVELARALARVLPEFPDWQVEIAGKGTPSCISGSDAGEIARKILEPFADRVRFAGPVKPEEVPQWLARMELCVFPSLWESFSYVVLEAAAAGKAIVATETGAVSGILDGGQAGEIVPPGDVKALTKALRKMMADQNLRRHHGQAARANAMDRYHPDKVTQQLLEAYQKAMSRRDERVKSAGGAQGARREEGAAA
jgi:glycosyltransferase involved in cell wall biosynthesis